ncbi:MAG: asparagine synthase (glutamine-hydrolyzing) [Eubacterium sp.]|nr:asparagine synthase (glutamine-hydrolyzing) [Eubacterium sp.]
MCGFSGFTGFLENREAIVEKMNERILHRGPDMGGVYVTGTTDNDSVALGFRRLSILDLSEDGKQPMFNEDHSIIVTFNGEIYNFMELRDQLKAKGHIFRSKTDTEVLLHGYEEWGEKLAEKLRGMFAFVIWDSNTNTLYGARDYFGIKPFYYSMLPGGNILFGSEIKSFLEHPQFRKEVNPDALRPYLTFQYSSMPETFFKGTYKLPQAHYFVLHDKNMRVERYWDVDFSKKTNKSLDQCAEDIAARVQETVNAHRIADVRVGSFLSGGVDSSFVTADLKPDDTFSVGFDYENFDETKEANRLSQILGVKNYMKYPTADECFDAFADIQYHMDEPQSNPSSVPLYFLARLAREHVTVVLSGEGADEIYAGYEWYDEVPLMQKYKKLPQGLRRLAARTAKKMPYFKGHDFIIKSSGDPEDYFIGQALVFPEDEAYDILQPKYQHGPTPHEITKPIYDRVKDLSELEKKQYLDLNLWLPGDILLKADKMAMASSLELRVPYLDRFVLEDAATLPAEYKINGINTKYVFRKAASSAIPDEWAYRTKKGFPVPIREWMRQEKYYNLIKDSFTSDAAAEYFKPDMLMKLLNDHYENKANNQRKIWTAYTFLTWHKVFFGE